MVKAFVLNQRQHQSQFLPIIFMGDTEDGLYCCLVHDGEIKYRTPPNYAVCETSVKFAAFEVVEELQKVGCADGYLLFNGAQYDQEVSVRENLLRASKSARGIISQDLFLIIYNALMRIINPKQVVPTAPLATQMA
ncbi:MAG: hypothetical protein KBC33_00830 [Candidatus Pacebacteria bacterium]|nr:hypothetical protein [Candidatus Paceibacterota bacterium]